MKKAGAEVVFCESSFVRQGNGSVYALNEGSDLFIDQVLCSRHKETVALQDRP